MTSTRIGYARCSTDKQDLAAQQAALVELGVKPDRIYTDRGLTGTHRARPGLDQALAGEKPTLVIFAEKRRPLPDPVYADGVRVLIARTRRNHPEALDPRIKSHNFLNNILARIEGDRALYHEVILRNLEGQLAEGTVSNLFFVVEGVLCTPGVSMGILDGITRETVIRIALKEGLRVKEGKFRPGDLKAADEAFICSSLQEIVPVVGVGKETIAAGRVGHWTRKLMDAYSEMVDQYVQREKAVTGDE